MINKEKEKLKIGDKIFAKSVYCNNSQLIEMEIIRVGRKYYTAQYYHQDYQICIDSFQQKSTGYGYDRDYIFFRSMEEYERYEQNQKMNKRIRMADITELPFDCKEKIVLWLDKAGL